MPQTTTADPCAEIEPLLAAYALGEDDPAIRGAIEAHLGACQACRQALAAYRGTARLLPLGTADVAPSPGLRDRVCDAVAAAARPARPRGRGPAPWLRPARALAALALALLLVWNVALQHDLATTRAEQRALAALIRAPDLELRPLTAGDPAPGASGNMLIDRDRQVVALAFSGLPPLPEGQVYQLWLIDPAEDRTSGGTFRVDDTGYATVVVRPPLPLASYVGVGITIEPTGGSQRPTGPRVIGGGL